MELKSLEWIEKTHKKINDTFYKDQRVLSFREYMELLEKEKRTATPL